MIHFLFLIASFGLVLVGQRLLLAVGMHVASRHLIRVLIFVVLLMPLGTLVLFGLTMLPTFMLPETTHHTNHSADLQWYIALGGVLIFTVPVIISLGFNGLKVCWLYFYTWRHSWQAPAGMVELAVSWLPDKARKSPRTPLTLSSSMKPSPQLKIRVWHSDRLFAFNLRALPLTHKGTIVVSTALVATLNEEELRAVLGHEVTHLIRGDFWFNWVAVWLRDAFLYLPSGGRCVEWLEREQELVCDEQVARQGGLSFTLALADALLKVWQAQETIEEVSRGLGCDDRTIYRGFKAPGLAARTKNNANLTEQRVNRLLELGETSGTLSLAGRNTLRRQLGILGLVTSGFGLWLLSLQFIHLLMIPFGCSI